MDPRAHRSVIDAAEFDVTMGWTTGVFMTLLRAVAVVAFLVAADSAGWQLGAQLGVQTLLAAGLTYGVYRRRPVAAMALAALYGLGYFYCWYLSARPMPPLALIGILIWYGLFRRGTRALAVRGQAPAAPG